MSRLEEQLRARFGARLRAGERLAAYTSFAIGGPADLFLVVETVQELAAAIAAAYENQVRAFCLGAGTNLLVSDRGIRGLVLRLGEGFRKISISGPSASAGAAVDFHLLVETVVERGLAGLEFAEGIPGSVGGGLMMNAGAFGGELSRVVNRIHGVSARGELKVLDKAEVKFGYRHAELPPAFVISQVDFELRPGDRDQLISRMRELRARRAERQPHGLANAGSVFKNPPDEFAGRLLERAGLKGFRIGGAGFSERHANFIVNLGGASAGEVRALMELARARVREQSGIELEPEVKLVGEW